MTDPTLSFDADEPLPLTGERTAPGIPEENYWFRRHEVVYAWLIERVRDREVLDAGCGEGYGTALLAGSARSVIGVDLEAPVLRRAAALYPRARFETANLVALPFQDHSFDAVVSLQVIEHLHTPQEFLAECKRVLRPGGLLVIATPNRLTFSPEGVRNPFHTFEFAPAELRTAVERHFGDVEVFGVFHGARIRAVERVTRRSFPEQLIERSAPEWPRWLRATVSAVRTSDFVIRSTSLESSLDLIAIARA